MKRILVTGAGGSASYNFIESLRDNPKKEKFYIVGTDAKPYHIELANVDKRYLLPRVSDPTYLKKLNSVIKKEKIDFLQPQPDGEVNFITKHVDQIQTKTLLPSYKTIEDCQDKMVFNQILKKNNVAVPVSHHITNEKELKTALNSLLKKNDRAWLRSIRGAGSKAALPIKKFEHAKAWIDYWRVMKGLKISDFMLAEYLPGKEYAFQSLWIDGKLIMSQARQRVEYLFGDLMPSGQTSTPSVALTIQDKEVNDVAFKAITAVDSKANGIYCVDMKTDAAGHVRVMEINAGRFFTTSYFFSKAGMNMPYYYTKYGLGEPVENSLKRFNNIPAGWHWVRMVDMGYKLIKKNEWTSKKV